MAGRNPVRELLRSGRPIQRLWVQEGERSGSMSELVALARRQGAVVQAVPRARLDELSAGVVHQGVVAAVTPFPVLELEQLLELVGREEERGRWPLLLFLDGIQDPQNLGACIRVAAGAGATAVVFADRRTAPLTAAVSKAAAGTDAHIPLVRVKNLAQAISRLQQEEGITVYAAESGGGRPYTEALWQGPVGIIIGSEGTGVHELVRKRADGTVSIPLAGPVESLNAATAAAVLLFEAVRQRGQAAMKRH
ncbi:23S rRNA (Guanosine(2251)-2'-O)-methyltransferase RlmB [Candidatus Hydrogenisulfobacillus filiaventi]|uniref:23S rRNA (Guanosine(2251)-2'-O)-methyltransferase RlmB n=1 Tax=Candidatus Hydrogenisulfobacillus filiaventi TaxID=2707344 RepID=A0A6F8ZJX6_9FIRM|nr:23S rRNA (guanosine(2251)-2'-O)-methyltransferase RlmB [Bacillota bacterium]CAB1129981.1 23S rRNA (Guanosine(2251)-2'-O)-methyltransferase RlmB [Candidatus Hydrogenisulfobacillus filiaventi]